MKKSSKVIITCLSFLLTGCDENVLENSSSSTEDVIESSPIIDSSSDIITSIPESDSSLENSEEEFIYFDKQIKLYVNPSVQYANLYADNLGNEGYYMNCISKLLVDKLETYTNLIVYSNNSYPGKSLKESVSESNQLKVDYHLSLHSNAGGGKGSEGFYTDTSYEFTKSIIDSLQEVLPYNTRGLKYGQPHLYELKRTNASASLIEILFHDDKTQALFIINNQKEIADAIYDGIVSYLK